MLCGGRAAGGQAAWHAMQGCCAAALSYGHTAGLLPLLMTAVTNDFEG